MQNSNVKLLINPKEFFRTVIINAANDQNIKLGEDVEFYLVNLLCEFIDPHKSIKISEELDLFDTPLALLLKKALESPPGKQISIYKALGDISLYMSGYFQDYFNTKTYDPGYFIALGSQAYFTISSIAIKRHKDKEFHKLYKELSEKFTDIVKVISYISEYSSKTQTPTSKNLLEMYEKWTKNHSARLRKKLEESGINTNFNKLWTKN